MLIPKENILIVKRVLNVYDNLLKKFEREMTRGKKVGKKWGRRRSDVGAERAVPEPGDERRGVALASVFRGEDIQEIAAILNLPEPDESHTLLGAVVLGKFDIVKKLLKDGHSIDSSTEDGVTAVMWAVRLSLWEMTELLVKRGASLTLTDREGNTTLLTAVQAPAWTQDMFLDLWNSIKDLAVDINHANKTGNSALHYAVKRQWDTAVEILTMDGANLNATTNKGVTAMMMACSRHQTDTIQTLLAHSPEMAIEDQKGCTAYCYAIAYMIQKKITTLDSAMEDLIDNFKNENSKTTVSMYLQRRLELLENPPVESYSKTITSVILNVVIFFIRFILEGMVSFLQLNVFKIIKNAVDKHLEDKDYTLGLLQVVTELVRVCQCCMPHVIWEDVMVAFNEAGIPAVCLKILKRFGASSPHNALLHAAFLPLFLTCKHALTKYWLQKNYKNLLQFYRNLLHNQSTPNMFYPDENHCQMVRKCSLHFKYLMSQLQRGSVIIAEERPSKRKKEKGTDRKDSKNQHSPAYFKKVEVSETEVKCEVKTEECRKEENIIVAVISNKKKEPEVLEVKEGSDSKEERENLETYWPLHRLSAGSEDTMEESGEEEAEEDPNDRTVYPKWREDFREGCELFGIGTEEEKEYDTAEKGNGDRRREEDVEEMECSLSHLDQLFSRVLVMYEMVWQKDYENGYQNAKADVKDYLKLMHALPDMETYHWLQMTEKWKDLCHQLRVHWKQNKNNLPVVELKNYLEDIADELNSKYDLIKPTEYENQKEIYEDNCSTNISAEIDTTEVQLKKDGEQISEDEKSTNEKVNTDSCCYKEGDGVRVRNNQNEKNAILSQKLDNPAEPCDGLCESDAKEWMLCEVMEGRQKGHPGTAPPGFQTTPIHSFLSEESWRQVEFSKDKHTALLKGLNYIRGELLKRKLMMNEVVLAPSPLQSQFVIGRDGSFGPLVLGLDLFSCKPLAVRKLPRTETLSQQMRSWQIRSLMRCLMPVRSGHLLPYSHCANTERHLLIATPLCQRNLAEHVSLLMKASRLTRLLATNMARQIINGLHFLHTYEPPIIHGNLKPSNVLIDAMGNLRLSEFGIHEVLYQQMCPSTETAMWWSRETYWHYQTDWKVMVTHKSDIQTCGMVCHFVVSGGLHPFGRTPSEVATAILTDTPILRVDSPEALDLISWMISCIPDHRPTSKDLINHVFNWEKDKKWKFLLVCAGVAGNKMGQGLPLEQLHACIDKYAKESNINTKWASVMQKETGRRPSGLDYPDTLSGLLRLLRDNLPGSVRWFLSLFPSAPLTLARLLEDTPWFSHPDLAQFHPF